MTVSLAERSVGNILVLTPSGRMDSQSASEFETAIVEKASHAANVVLDLVDVPYVSSAGLRVVLVIAKRVAQAKGKFGLATLRPEILSVFRISGLTKVLKIFDTAEQAVAAFGAS